MTSSTQYTSANRTSGPLTKVLIELLDVAAAVSLDVAGAVSLKKINNFGSLRNNNYYTYQLHIQQ